MRRSPGEHDEPLANRCNQQIASAMTRSVRTSRPNDRRVWFWKMTYLQYRRFKSTLGLIEASEKA